MSRIFWDTMYMCSVKSFSNYSFLWKTRDTDGLTKNPGARRFQQNNIQSKHSPLTMQYRNLQDSNNPKKYDLEST